MSEVNKGTEKNAIREIEQELKAVKNSLKEIEQDAKKQKIEEAPPVQTMERKKAPAKERKVSRGPGGQFQKEVVTLKQGRASLADEVEAFLDEVQSFMQEIRETYQNQAEKDQEDRLAYIANFKKLALKDKLDRLESLKELHQLNRQSLEEFKERLELEGARSRERRFHELQEIRENLQELLAPYSS